MTSRPLRIFFSGIGGSGVSALASFMADKGHTVIGSDRSFDQNPAHPMVRILKSKGMTIVPQDGSCLDRSLDLAVFSTAVELDQPELIRAYSLGITVKTRPEYLADIVADYETIAVAGTSGKSTTAGMLAFLMQRLGLKPNYIGGGRVKQFRTDKNPGNAIVGDSTRLVIEACESDGTIVNYKPAHSLLLNLALDHHSVNATAGMFQRFIGNTAGKTVMNADDIHLRDAITKPTITFSIDNPSDYKADDVFLQPLSTSFSLQDTRFSLSLPGRHNLYNALSCLALLSETGIPLRDSAEILAEFRGIERRFDIHLNDGGHLVIDDYAHNPHKIFHLMDTIKRIRGSVCYIFQPHGYGPTRLMKDAYIDVFRRYLRDSDHLILLPIYYAGGAARKDISSHDLATAIGAGGRSAEAVENRGVVLERFREWDSYVICGARDETLSDLARDLACLLHHSL